MKEISRKYFKDKEFYQHNLDIKKETIFQCPKCLSYNTDIERVYASGKVQTVYKQCLDCGYEHYKNMSKGNDTL